MTFPSALLESAFNVFSLSQLMSLYVTAILTFVLSLLGLSGDLETVPHHSKSYLANPPQSKIVQHLHCKYFPTWLYACWISGLSLFFQLLIPWKFVECFYHPFRIDIPKCSRAKCDAHIKRYKGKKVTDTRTEHWQVSLASQSWVNLIWAKSPSEEINPWIQIASFTLSTRTGRVLM